MSANESHLETLFVAALEIEDEGQRDAFLKGACVGDSSKLAQLQSLVHDYYAAGTLLDRPAGGIATILVPQTKSDALGSQIGPYKLREVLGEGGMGTVFVAEQEKPVRRKVALKLVKLGMDSKEVLSRFEAERQALALMDHPNIARVLDAGMTDAGRPYFVMELVKGLPITEHCDLHKLGSRERLELFVQVCRAIQHAHQKGIIHRDLKPSNVLVAMHDTIPVVKVIDFGVAKAIGQPLTEKTLYTGLGVMVGTPMYMSPEQAGQSSIDVDTRSDVYSLGVLLYELLTGCTPFEKDTLKRAGFDELRRIIQEVDPPRPSTRFSTLNAVASSTIANCRQSEPHKLSQQLRGELDWIVMKALEKDRTRRYESASAFAADVEHYLCDEPVEACPPSAMYRFRKYARRRKFFLTAAFAIGFAVLMGTGLSIWQAVEAIQARKLADERLGLANERLARETEARVEADKQRQQASKNLQLALDAVDQMLLRVADERLASIPGAEPVRQELFQEALTFYETFFEQSPDDPHLRVSTANAWAQVGKLYEFTGNVTKAQKARQDAIQRWERMVEESPDDAGAKKSLSEVYIPFAECEHWGRNRFSSAEQAMLRAVELLEELASQFPDTPSYPWEATRMEITLADNYKCTNRLDLAEQTFRRVIARQRDLWHHRPISGETHWMLANSLSIFATFLHEARHRDEELETLYEEALVYAEKVFAVEPDASLWLVMTTHQYGEFLKNSGRLVEAEKNYRRGIQVGEQQPSSKPRTPIQYLSLGQVHLSLANLLTRDGRHTEALDHYYRSSELLRPSVFHVERNGGFEGTYNRALQGILTSLDYLSRTGNLEVAKRFCENLPQETGPHSHILLSRFLAIEAWERSGDAERAEQLRTSLIGDLEKRKSAPADAEEHVGLGRIVFGFGDKEFHRSQYARAMPLLNLALRLDPKNAEALDHRGLVELYRGEYEKALEDLDASLAHGAPYRADTLRSRAIIHFRLQQYSATLAALAETLAAEPHKVENLSAIDPAEIASCPDEEFRKNYLAWFNQAFKATNSAPAALVERAALSYELGIKDEAESDLAAILADSTDAPGVWSRAAFVSLRLGNTSRYRDFCQRLVKGGEGIADEATCRDIVWPCVVAREAIENYEPVVAVARRGLTFDATMCQYLLNLGAALFRAGQFDEALVHLNSASSVADANDVRSAYIACFLAMTHHRLGHADEAKRWYDEATESARKLLTPESSAKTPPLFWNRRLTLQLLQAEAVELLQITNPEAAVPVEVPESR